MFTIWNYVSRISAINLFVTDTYGGLNLTVKWLLKWAVVVAKLAERLLPIPEVCGSIPVITKFLFRTFIFDNCIDKTKIKKKEAGNGPF